MRGDMRILNERFQMIYMNTINLFMEEIRRRRRRLLIQIQLRRRYRLGDDLMMLLQVVLLLCHLMLMLLMLLHFLKKHCIHLIATRVVDTVRRLEIAEWILETWIEIRRVGETEKTTFR